MSRVPPVPVAEAGLVGRAAYAYARRTYGDVPAPAAVWRRHPGIFWSWSTFELANQRALRVLPTKLRELAIFRTAVGIGCSWCVDFGSAVWTRQGLNPDLLRAVASNELAKLDDDERAVVAYADAMTQTPPDVGDEMVADLRRRFGDDGVVELTYVVALENMRSRFNAALGLVAQGFSDGEACRLVADRRRAVG